MKIGYRFAALYFVVTLLILIIFSLSVYWGMKRILLTTLDENLHFVVNSIEANYDPSNREFDYIEKEGEKANPFLEYYLVIYDINRKAIYRSAIAQKLHIAIPFSNKHAAKGFTTRITVKEAVQWVHPDRGGEITFRAFNRKIYYENQQIGWVTIARPIEEVDESLNKLAFVFSIAILGTVLLIATGSYFLTKRVLSPISLITERANQISHKNLNERIGGVHSNDELGALANTLNGLLDRLQRAFESQQQFLADAAHELKTPISVLRAHWEEELNNAQLPVDLRLKLAHDVEMLSRLNHLIKSLLLLSKTENIYSDFSFKPVALEDMLKEVISDASVLADGKKQTIKMGHLDSTTVLGDRNRLYQMFFNIVENAVKFTPRGGSIKIAARRKNQNVEVSVADNGPGIPSEDLPHIFDRFYRVKKDRSRETGGSGLGLAISRLIAEIHGGTIRVISEVGKGSRFEIMLKSVHS